MPYGRFEEVWAEGVEANADTELGHRADMYQTIGGAMARRVFGWMNVDETEGEALMRAHPEAWTSASAAHDFYAANPQKYQEVTGRPFVEGQEIPVTPEMSGGSARRLPAPEVTMRPTGSSGIVPEASVTPALPGKAISPDERDVVIRTVLGEAAGESNAGMAAVAMVIRNRADDARYPDTVGEVSRQPRQFSAWNEDGSGNDLVTKYGPGSPQYERAAYIVDVVMAGLVPDFTEGATHYYSPAGMRALVDQGYQKNLIPTWLERETATRDTLPVRIGGHVFTGQAKTDE
jgi:Cell wall hydrolyses involved in spore germination